MRVNGESSGQSFISNFNLETSTLLGERIRPSGS
jgi:hypothetical protein